MFNLTQHELCSNIDLRREARFLENEIDAKLVSFSKIGANTPISVASDRYSTNKQLIKIAI